MSLFYFHFHSPLLVLCSFYCFLPSLLIFVVTYFEHASLETSPSFWLLLLTSPLFSPLSRSHLIPSPLFLVFFSYTVDFPSLLPPLFSSVPR